MAGPNRETCRNFAMLECNCCVKFNSSDFKSSWLCYVMTGITRVRLLKRLSSE